MVFNKNIAVSESGFVFNPSTGDSFSVNQTANKILKLLQEEKTNKEIIAQLNKEFSIDVSTIEKDLNDFLYQLNAFQIISQQTKSN
jgi:PqqD family protein of HPr-rel-A system